MASSRFRPDRGLVTRMLVTVFLLGLLYVLFVGVLIAVNVPWLLIVIIAGGFFLVQYFASDRIALFAVGGHVVTPEEAPELHAIVDRLCALADMPKPVVAIADVDMPNAFATGRSQKRAVVCATTGIMRRLDNDELEGVLAHELSHVAHRDVVVMTVASFLGVLAGIVTRFAFYSEMFGGGRRNDRDNTAGVVAVVMLASGLVYALSFVLIRTLSPLSRAGGRPVGCAAHRPAVRTGQRPGQGHRRHGPDPDQRPAPGRAVQRVLLHPALAPGFSLSSLFSTHPSLEVRLNNLGEIARELGQPV